MADPFTVYLTDVLEGEDKQTIKDIILEENYLKETGVNTLIDTKIEKLYKVNTPEDYGAFGDYNPDTGEGHDDTIPLKTLFSECSRIKLLGKYLCKEKLISDKLTSLTGDGMGVSSIVWTGDAVSEGIVINVQDDSQILTIKDFSLFTEKKAVGTALQIDWTLLENANGILQDRTTPRGGIKNIFTAGKNGVVVDGWMNGIKLIGSLHFTILGHHFTGCYGTTQENILSGKGIWLDGNGNSASTEISNCWSYYASDALYSDSAEGVYVDHCNFVAVTTALNVFSSFGGEPQLNVANNHFNVTRYGIKTKDINQITVHDNLFYGRKQVTNSISFILLDNVYGGSISNNDFTRLEPTQAVTHIHLTNGTKYMNINKNVHRSGTTGIKIDNGAYGNLILPARSITHLDNSLLDIADDSKKNFISGLLTEFTKTQTQTITAGTQTVVTFDTASDLNVYGTSLSIFAIPISAKYRLEASVIFPLTTDKSELFILRILKNGIPIGESGGATVVNAGRLALNVSITDKLSEGDEISVAVLSNTITASFALPVDKTRFSIEQIGPYFQLL